jgi:hypothetical protein
MPRPGYEGVNVIYSQNQEEIDNVVASKARVLPK